MVIAVFEPQRAGIQSGFIVSTIGITAIVLGVKAVKVSRWGSATVRAFGRGGAILGTAGTALMAYAVIAAMLVGVGVRLPALSFPTVGGDSYLAASVVPPRATVPSPSRSASTPAAAPAAQGSAGGQAPAAQGASAGQAAVPAAPSAPPTVQAERSALAQSAGSLAFVMNQAFGSGPFPSTLMVGGSAPERIMTAGGSSLAAVPDGTRIVYSVSPDGSSWAVTLVGARFGAVATYSSTVGTVQVG
ncbi:hypothetical protein ACTJKO_12920 [Curtobacterium sp. 22159]|uniref:hypothetical protein n=1 Tax=Curtobacterium sp. 22159 TaxID=3453882 RepID=UPI003F84D363